MVRLAIIAFLLLILQGGLTYFQIKDYRRKIRELNNMGIIGIGTNKGKIGQGSIIILVSDNSGIVLACEEMRGRTVFSRFKKNNDYNGKSIYDLKKLFSSENKKRKSSLLKAVETIESQLVS